MKANTRFRKTRTGSRIRTHRHAASLTQGQLAAMCGVDESTIRNYELGNRMPGMEMIRKIADALGISPHALTVPEIPDMEAAKYTVMELEKFGLPVVESGERKYLDITDLFRKENKDEPRDHNQTG